MKHTFAILGHGYLSQIIIEAYDQGLMPDFELIGVYKRTTEASDQTHDYDIFYDVKKLLEKEPEFVVESTSRDFLYTIGEDVVKTSHLVLLSIGALANIEFKNNLEKEAQKNNKKVYIASGAVGGFDVMRTISLMGKTTTTLHSKKNPNDLQNTVLYKDDYKQGDQIFELTTREAYEKLPTQVNIAIATALAGSGIDETMMSMDAHLNFVGDEYDIKIISEEARATFNIYSKTSAIAAYSAVHVLNNAVSVFVF